MSIKEICKKLGITPSKSRGQNFLIDKNIINKLILEAQLQANDLVLEIGPGLGILTEQLLTAVKQVIAIEIDRKLVVFLQEKFASAIKSQKLILIESDILKANLPALGFSDFNFKLVANLPYSLTSKIFRLFLEIGPRPSSMVVMVQKEVAQRLMAQSGEMNLLSLSTQLYSYPQMLFEVKANSFWPIPEVDSAVVKLNLKTNINPQDYKLLFRLARIGFAAKRKQLHNNLAGGLRINKTIIKEIITDLGWEENLRAQNLSVDDWIALTKNIQALLKSKN